MTQEQFNWITKWQKETFPSATAQSVSNHLREEVTELIHDLTFEFGKDRTVSEYADCFLLLFCSACLYGLSYEDICKAIESKMEVNKQRTWGKVNEHGYVKHIEDNQNKDQ